MLWCLYIISIAPFFFCLLQLLLLLSFSIGCNSRARQKIVIYKTKLMTSQKGGIESGSVGGIGLKVYMYKHLYVYIRNGDEATIK